MHLAVAQMIDFRAAAVLAELAVAPTDRTQMVNAGLFVGEGFKVAVEAVEIRKHGSSPSIWRSWD